MVVVGPVPYKLPPKAIETSSVGKISACDPRLRPSKQGSHSECMAVELRRSQTSVAAPGTELFGMRGSGSKNLSRTIQDLNVCFDVLSTGFGASGNKFKVKRHKVMHLGVT